MPTTAQRFAIIFVLGLAVGAVSAFAAARLTSPSPKVWEEWTLPARFEGQGAFTLGCAFWDVPHLTAYGDDNPRTDLVSLAVGGESTDVQAFAVIDGPRGTAAISGSRCAVSVDWNAFPTRQRAPEP